MPSEEFAFVTTDLTVAQVRRLAEYSRFLDEKKNWSAWAAFFDVAAERLAHPEDRARLDAVPWGRFGEVLTAFTASLEANDKLRALERSYQEPAGGPADG